MLFRVAPGTIKGVDASGNLQYGTAGLLKDGAEDDGTFDRIGQILADYYTAPRRKVSIWTHRTSADLKPGKLILAASRSYDVTDPFESPVDIVANALIAEVTIDLPIQSAGKEGEAPLVRITTYTPDDIDPLAIAGNLLNASPGQLIFTPPRPGGGLNAVAALA
jgi:hypothetical protein